MAVFIDTYGKRVRYVDGEGVEASDLTTMQINAALQSFENFMLSSLTDVIDEPSAAGTEQDLERGLNWNTNGFTTVGGDLVFAPYPSTGYVQPNGVANQLACVPGPLLVAMPGEDAFASNIDVVLPFRLSNTVLTTAAGDGANPRIDLVEIKAEAIDTDGITRHFEDAVTRAKTSTVTNKSRAIQVTIQIKQGTAGANPGYPALTAGFVALAAIRVPAAHNAAHSADNVRDLRMPLGRVAAYDVPAHLMYRSGATPWTLSSTDWLNTAPGSATALYAQCPVGSRAARLVGLGLYGNGSSAPVCNLKRVEHDGAAPTYTTLADLQLNDDLFANGTGFRTKSLVELMQDLGGAGGHYQGVRLANTRVGTPVWCSSHAAGVARPRTADADNLPVLAVEINGGSGCVVSLVRFYVAQGM